MINTIALVGRLTKKPEKKLVSYNNNQFSRVFFRLAVNEKDKEKKDKTYFIPCSASGSLADNMDKFLDSGSLIAVQGKLITYDAKNNNGDKQLLCLVTVQKIQFLDFKTSNGNQSDNKQAQVPEETDLPF